MIPSLPQNLLASLPSHQEEKTVLLLALEGWNDAGEVATDAVTWLQKQFSASPYQGFESESYYLYTETRPLLEASPEGGRTISWPETRFFSFRPRPGLRIITLLGPEPNLNWKSYRDQVLELARREKVDLFILTGSLLDEVPHTMDFPLAVSSESAELQALTGLEGNTYTGPTGMVGVLAQAAAQAQLASLSLWVSVPHYLAHPPQPKGLLALVKALGEILALDLPLKGLEADLESWVQSSQDLLEEEPELRAYVQQLESSREAQQDMQDLLKVDIAAEFERFLKGGGNSAA